MVGTLVAGRYKVVDRVGEGGMGAVYRVEDLAEGGAVRALKVLPRTGGQSSLRGEFLALARLAHENIVRVHDYGVTEKGEDFFTMDYLAGRDLLAAAPPADSPGIYRLIGGVSRALSFLHARGLVHADIKPSNLVVVDGEPDLARAVRLLDFGLAARASDPESARARGTFPFAAPEVYAGRLDARSDLYALGVSIYRAVAGIFPYPGDDPADVVRRQRSGPPPDPREHRSAIPAPLAELLLRLLDPEPAARCQSAEEILEKINEIAGTDFVGDAAAAVPLVELASTLVGRQRDLAELERLWAETRAGQGRVALLVGEEGIGKSRVAGELKLRVQLGGGRLFEVGRDPAAFRPLTEIARALAALATQRAPDALEARRATLAPLLDDPTAQAVAAGSAASGVVERPYALFEAVAALMLDMAAREPFVLLVEDLGRADRTALEGLAYLARAAAAGPVFFLFTARLESGGEAAARALLGLGPESEHVHVLALSPLDRQSFHELIATAVGPAVAEAVAASLHRATGGNPAYAQAALRMLVERGDVRREHGAWVLAVPHPEIPEVGDALATARQRAAALAPAHRDLLAAAAILGPRLDARALVRVTGASQSVAAEAFAAATRSGLLRALEGDGAGLGFAPGAARALVEALTAERRRALHAAAAATLEADRAAGRPIDDEALARHHLGSEDPERALASTLRVAALHEARGEQAAAAALYDALLGLPLAPGARADALERLGDARCGSGDVEAGERAYDQALDLLGSPGAPPIPGRNGSLDCARLLRKLGELARRAGNQDRAIARFAIAIEAAKMATETAAETAAGDRREEALASLGMARSYLARAEYDPALRYAHSGMAVSEGHPGLRGRLRSLEGVVAFFRGDIKPAIAIHEDARLSTLRGGDPLDVAYVDNNLGIARHFAGDLAGATDAYESALAQYEHSGALREAVTVAVNLGGVCWLQGQWPRARQLYRRTHELASRMGQKPEAARGLGNLGMVALGSGDLAEALTLLDRAAALMTPLGLRTEAVVVLGNRAEVLARKGDLAGARELFERTLKEGEALGLKEQVCEDKRRLCEVDLAEGRIEAALDRALDVARDAAQLGLKLEEGNLHRVAAAALRLQGDLESAAWFLGKAEEILKNLGVEYERAKVDLEAAELAAARRDFPAARERVERAIVAFSRLGARWDLGRARERRRAFASISGQLEGMTHSSPRLEALLEVSRATGWILDLERLLDIVLDKMLAATGFERGFLLLLDEHGRPTVRKTKARAGQTWGGDAGLFSGSIVRKVAETGEPLIVKDVFDDAELRAQRSVMALNLRSALCAPMRTQGRLVGIVYVDSQDIPEQAAKALSLLEALAGQAAIAIENARLFAEQQRKAELMAMLAHEIRNPLSAILAFSDVTNLSGPTEIEAIPEKIRADLRRIQSNALRLTQIVENILELARMETGKVEWSLAPLATGALLREVAQGFAPLLEKKKIAIAVEAGSIADALANSDRIFQVVANLVGNALKFTPSGGSIALRAREETVAVRADGGQRDAPPELAYAPQPRTIEQLRKFIRIEVADTGPGIEPDRMARIFDKFGQAEAGKRRGSGVGLGLYISREIVKQHGGTIWAESELGKGTTFAFRLPAAE